jgi:hypothetical protein
MTTMTTTAPNAAIPLHEIPRYFGGGTSADHLFDHAVDALIALTGRGKDDAAIQLIVGELEHQHGELLEMACNFGRCIPDSQLGLGIDEWDDEVLLEVTGRRRS